MKPEHEMRRKIIREWMSLPRDKRQTEEQARPFAKKAMDRMRSTKPSRTPFRHQILTPSPSPLAGASLFTSPQSVVSSVRSCLVGSSLPKGDDFREQFRGGPQSG